MSTRQTILDAMRADMIQCRNVVDLIQISGLHRTAAGEHWKSDAFQGWFNAGTRVCRNHAYPVEWHLMRRIDCPRCGSAGEPWHASTRRATWSLGLVTRWSSKLGSCAARVIRGIVQDHQRMVDVAGDGRIGGYCEKWWE